MNRIETPLFGEIEIDQEQVVTFPHGVPGFEQEHQYVFIPLEDSLFVVMQSIQSPLYFVVINPFQVFPDYDFSLSSSDQGLLGINDPKDVVVYNIVVLRDELAQSTVNMQAPIVVNIRSKQAKQILLNQYQIKQPLFPNALMSHAANG